MTEIIIREQVRAQLALRDAITTLRERLEDEEGQTSVEYVGLAVVIVAIIAAFAAFGPEIAKSLKNAITTQIDKLAS